MTLEDKTRPRIKAIDMIRALFDHAPVIKGENVIGILNLGGGYNEEEIKQALANLVIEGRIDELYPKGTPPEKQIPENAHYASRRQIRF